MRTVLLIVFLILSFSITAHSWEKVPVPDYVDKKVKSPWNFYEDFEDQKVGKLKLKKLTINNKGAGLKPFKIKKDLVAISILKLQLNMDGIMILIKKKEKKQKEQNFRQSKKEL